MTDLLAQPSDLFAPAGSTFKAATWNPYHGTELAVIEPILRSLLLDGVSVLLVQEALQDGLEDLFRANGLRTYRHDQYMVAWRPSVWKRVDVDAVRLSQTAWFAADRNRPKYVDAAAAILSDYSGRTLTALSYHTPPHVQVPPRERPERRVIALREAMASLSTIASTVPTRAVLFGGDDNVDEARAYERFFRFMLEAATGLAQVQAPSATHGRVRRIDDFRVRGLKPLEGSVVPGGGDHRIHVREFAWL